MVLEVFFGTSQSKWRKSENTVEIGSKFNEKRSGIVAIPIKTKENVFKVPRNPIIGVSGAQDSRHLCGRRQVAKI